MTASIEPRTLATLERPKRERREHALEIDPVVGKDVLELLSSAMYVDPLTIYREYIQNAADAVDEAFAQGLFGRETLGRVDVRFEIAERTALIRDNGIGIGARDAERILTSVGASAKRGTNSRGFRGVGRLAAFGYAQTVTFRTKAFGEDVVTEIRWDCRRMKAALLDAEYAGDLRQIFRDTVLIATERGADKAAHFFEVKLHKVVRIGNDVLLDPEIVQRYLSQVAPAPFHNDFEQAAGLSAALVDHVPPCRFRLFVDGSSQHVTRPHRTTFLTGESKEDSIRSVDTHVLHNGDGRPQAVLWIAHHGYEGTLKMVPEMRGLRARAMDVQVGDEQIFAPVFPEPRFNGWTIGEIHILDRRIVPNGRRDGFEQNEAYADLVSQLRPILREIGAACRRTSAIRNRLRAFDRRADALRQLFSQLVRRNLTRRQQARIRGEIGTAIAEMKRVARYSGFTRQEQLRLSRKVATLSRDYRGLEVLKPDSPRLLGVPQAQRAIYDHIVELVQECAPNKTIGQALTERLVARIEADFIRVRRRRPTVRNR